MSDVEPVPGSSTRSGAAFREPLSPVGFLLRAASTRAATVAVAAGSRSVDYAELLERVKRLAGLLKSIGVEPGDRVAMLLPNTPAALELHFAVPGVGAVLVPVNHRLGPRECGYAFRHAAVRCVVVHASLREIADTALEGIEPRPAVLVAGEGDENLERAMAAAEPVPLLAAADEDALISINYTSGTTGDPKGVMCTHRGSFVSAVAHVYENDFGPDTRYLWTLPMSHCNGWTHPWAVTAAGGRHVCLEQFNPVRAWQLLKSGEATHLAGAPTLFTMLAGSPQAAELDNRPRAMIAGAALSAPLLRRLTGLGFDVVHGYGLTETYGPLCASRASTRQGTPMLVGEPIRVVNEEMRDVPADGDSIGEIVFKGNNVTPGYYLDPQSTADAWRGGWFHSGDLAVLHPNGEIEIRDRAKDIVIFGGENVSTIEVEQVLLEHPNAVQAAVVGVPDDRWGEVLCAYVVPRERIVGLEEELRSWVDARLAPFKVPRRVVLREALPTTPTGKIEKRALREET